MTISSALNAGVAGLAAHSMRLATISDNISNSGTYGYKRVETDFDAMVLNQAAGSGIYSAGGVRASSHRVVDQEGALIGTSNALDIAISGRGMLPVTSAVDLDNESGDLPFMMTRTGGFRADKEGVLRTSSGLVLLGWAALPDGTIPLPPRDTMGSLEPVKIPVNQTSSDPTENILLGVNLPSDDTEAGAAGTSIKTKVEYFDNLGTSQFIDITFTPSVGHASGKSNLWRMTVEDTAVTPATLIGEYDIQFSDDRSGGGKIQTVTVISGGGYDTTTGKLSLTVDGGPIAMEIGREGFNTPLSQVGNTFSPINITKDGSPVGNLTGVEIDENGFIRATYDTGFFKTLYQVPVVDVPNPNGLFAMDAQTYKVSPTSGSFFLWDAGDGPTGEIRGYAREESTTDVAAELTDLIVTQRAYSSNAKVIQTVDEMLQETTNLKR